MVTREELLEVLNSMITDKNKSQIEALIEKLTRVSDEELGKVLEEQKIKRPKDIKKVVGKMVRDERRIQNKFEPLNDLISYGVTGKTLHIHLIPKDARHMLTREGMKEAQIALIDAIEKLKLKIQTDKRYRKIRNVYAVSPIMTGIVSRWFKELGFDVKTLPVIQAKEDKELRRFTTRFSGATKLGRANLTKEQLMSSEWEERKDALRERLGVPIKKEGFIESLQTMNNTEQDIVANTEQMENRETQVKEVQPENIE